MEKLGQRKKKNEKKSMAIALRKASESTRQAPVSYSASAAKSFFDQFNNNPVKIKTHVFKNSQQIKDLVAQAKNPEYRNSEVINYFGQNERIVDSQNKQTRLTNWCKDKPDHILSGGYGQNEILLEEDILPRHEKRKLLRWAIENKDTKFGFSLLSSFGYNPDKDPVYLKQSLLDEFPEIRYETHRRQGEREIKEQRRKATIPFLRSAS